MAAESSREEAIPQREELGRTGLWWERDMLRIICSLRKDRELCHLVRPSEYFGAQRSVQGQAFNF